MKSCPNCEELLGDSVNVCFKCNYDFRLKKVVDKKELNQRRITAENQQIKAAEREEEKKQQRELQLEKNPQFEYKSVSLDGLADGTVNNYTLQDTLDKYSGEGWKLHSALSGYLIFERCIKS